MTAPGSRRIPPLAALGDRRNEPLSLSQRDISLFGQLPRSHDFSLIRSVKHHTNPPLSNARRAPQYRQAIPACMFMARFACRGHVDVALFELARIHWFGYSTFVHPPLHMPHLAIKRPNERGNFGLALCPTAPVPTGCAQRSHAQ